MGDKDKRLVVISVLEGRHFPKRPRHQLIAEARFQGELLATDPVDHVEGPDFSQELAWELDKKALQQHRLQRTSIKIQCYAYDANSTLKEAVGYVVLDLRSATTNKQMKWYPLLHSKYHKATPEICLALYLDSSTKPLAPQEKTSSLPIKVPLSGSPSTSILDLRNLVPMLNEDEGYYQIGPAKKCTENFTISVTVAYASNLAQLIPSSTALPAGGSYFFYYSLLGNDVTNQVFADLINPTFPAERASVRLRSNVDVLRTFFQNQPGLQIHLCCGNQSLGSCEIPLSSLLKPGSTEIFMKPVTIEGAFQLIPPNQSQRQLPDVSSEFLPAVGVVIELRKVDMAARTPVKDLSHLADQSLGASPSLKPPPHKKSPAKDQPAPRQGKEKKKEEKRAPSPPRKEDRKEDEYSDSFEEVTPDSNGPPPGPREEGGAGGEQAPRPGKSQTQAGPSQVPLSGDEDTVPGTESESTTQHHVAVPPQAHHFTFSVDLRSVRNVDSSTTIHVYLRYTYPFFGSAAPILTHPPMEIRRGMEVLLPQSFCAFDFACTMSQLQETFLRVPLTVEMWHRDRQLSKDVLLGTAILPLANIITADKARIVNSTGGSGWRQEYSDKVPMSGVEGSGARKAELSVVLSLEDWGPLAQQTVMVGQPSTQTTSAPQPQPSSLPAAEAEEAVEPRETQEYQAALELEMWKEAQEQAFQNQLKQKETMLMKAIGEEFRKRDRERELIMQKKIAEYTQCEEKLRKTLSDIEKKEKQLASTNEEVSRLKVDLQRDHERKLQELKEASRRLKEECDHRVELERIKVKEFEDTLARYKQEAAEVEKRYRALEKEFSVYKEQINSKPEVRLQSEINLLTLEKVELERKLDSVTKSKVHYKQQWGRALKELARLKQREQELARADLKRKQAELEHMRLQYLAKEEKEVGQGEKKQLEEIKNELNKLQKLQEEKLKQSSDSYDYNGSPRTFDTLKPLNTDMNDESYEELTRLIEERDGLLRTGVYSSQDTVIAELDSRIQSLMMQKKR